MTRSKHMLGYINRRDHRLMRRVNRWQPPRWVRIWMLCASRAGDGWLWWGLGAIILMAGGERRFMAAGAAALAAGIGVTTFLQLKKFFNRQRPCATEPHCWATLLPPDQFSFPSGHTISAFAVSVPLSYFYPDLTAGLLFCALSIAASRVMLGMHFLSDVLAGIAIGTAMAMASVWLVHLIA
jgi:undecaprenyl-diphosphatase